MENWQFCTLVALMFGISGDLARIQNRLVWAVVDGLFGLAFAVAAIVFLVAE